MKPPSTLTREDLIEIGFKEIPHFTIMNNLLYDLGRDRYISIGSLATPNEMVFIQQVDTGPFGGQVVDIIALRNYDYDGYTTIEDIKTLITGITGRSI